VRDYEMMIVLDPNLDEGQTETQTGRVEALVTQRGGTIQNTDVWGRRRLAYHIGRFRDGFYVLYRLQMPPEAAAEIEHGLTLMESVIRYLIVRAEDLPFAPAAPATAPAVVSAPVTVPDAAPVTEPATDEAAVTATA
jgi:small subunit ribosomal protein S6